ncbi:MAG: phage holin family protein [Lonepinella koalarum]|nr:phage holin family protein [Lonepinella koalarum]
MIKKFKYIFLTVLELMQVRLETARIELIQQKNLFITLLISILLSFLLLFVAFISFLFALNSYLAPEMKSIVFFSITGSAIFIVAILLCVLFNTLKKQQGFLSSTLFEMKRDFLGLKALIIEKSEDEDNR